MPQVSEHVLIWKQQIVVPLDMDESFEWSNNFVLMPKVNGCQAQQSVNQTGAYGPDIKQYPSHAGRCQVSHTH